ncbi:scavenger receptor class B member 1-like isoform X2 [Coccinella septempunctata]|uniref:scavenger receptor class B member 1-like isoform X2 n=1 Tax=Coccinella septempunctata TaxID=41139 RepID=UPI001D06818E|nr:scavenger receptor class B member 1-like isoform X2 [Coccinella septempunctata]
MKNLFGGKMGLYKQYFRVTRHARDKLFGKNNNDYHPLQMLISEQGKLSHKRLAVVLLGIFTLAIGIILSSIPWLDYLIIKNLRLWNGSISFQYWQKPGVIRLTKVYIFNVTNPDGFLQDGDKPRLQEIGPFVYREEMEKVNIKFHDNGTVSYQHKKILQFVPELSVNKEQKITVPNIPLLTLAMHSNTLGFFLQKTISLLLNMGNFKPFVTVTADELVFGYDDKLVSLAHQFYPKRKRPMSKMGLLINRNGTLDEVHNMYTGMTGMQEFGLLDRVNGVDRLPFWEASPCNSLTASEGSFFPPRDVTKSNMIYLYDKDLCRILPMEYKGPTNKNGIRADIYSPPENIFETVDVNPDNKCYCAGNEFCPPKGLQNISPCQFDAPVYVSFPHFYKADPRLSEPFEGLNPSKEKHETYFKVQPKLGVPLEAKVRVQLNLKVDQAPYVTPVRNFPSMIYPIMWLEEGIDDLTPPIRRWIYLGTTFAEIACPLMTYSFIFIGSCILIGMFVNGYKSILFTKRTIEIGMKQLRRRSAAYIHHPEHLITRHEVYTLLDVPEEAQRG